jgi:hypothetical protein
VTGPWIVAFGVLSLVVVLLAALVLGLSARVISVLARAEALLNRMNLDEVFRGLEVGASLPEFTAEHVGGLPIEERPPASGRLLLFLDADCAPCRDLVVALDREDVQLPLEKVAVLQPVEGSRLPSLPAGWTVLAQRDRKVSRALRVSATPYAYVVDGTNTVTAAGIPNSPPDLQRLVSSLLLVEAVDNALPVSEPVPLATPVAERGEVHVHH